MRYAGLMSVLACALLPTWPNSTFDWQSTSDTGRSPLTLRHCIFALALFFAI